MKQNKTVLITGASGGIGRELAFLFAKDGYHVVLVARNLENLHALATELFTTYGVNCTPLACDLAQLGAPRELLKCVEDLKIHVDILVNNAGFGFWGSFQDMDEPTQNHLIQLNITALTQLSRLFLTPMVKRGLGYILNVASTAAFQPGPWMAVYYATKAYVLSFSEALHVELRGTGVVVTALCPGPTRSGFQDAAHIQHSLQIFRPPFVGECAQVARVGYRGLFAEKRVVVPGLFNKMGVCFAKWLPRSIVLWVVCVLQGKKN
jgi:short-subunit dehydrogenase